MAKEEKLDLESVIAKINKNAKKTVITKASEALSARMYRIPTGVFAFDYALGGGIPVGRITLIHGKESSGKSALAAKALSAAQKTCSECFKFELDCTCKKFKKMGTLWIDVEGTYEVDWNMKLGINNEEMYYVRPDYAGEAIDVIDNLIRTGEIKFIVLDSLAALITRAEIDDLAEKPQMGRSAVVINRAFKKWISAMNEPDLKVFQRATMVVLNQPREKIGVMWGNPETLPGGKGQSFYPSIVVRMGAPKIETHKDSGDSIYALLNFVIKKNKTAPAGRGGDLKLWLQDDPDGGPLGGQTNEDEIVAKYAQKYDLIRKGDNGWMALNEEFRIKKDIEDRMKSDKPFNHKLRTELMDVLLGNKCVANSSTEREKSESQSS